MLTLETARIFSILNSGRRVGLFTFDNAPSWETTSSIVGHVNAWNRSYLGKTEQWQKCRLIHFLQRTVLRNNLINCGPCWHLKPLVFWKEWTVAKVSASSLSTTPRLEEQPHQLWAMLTLETARIFSIVNSGRRVGLFTFDNAPSWETTSSIVGHVNAWNRSYFGKNEPWQKCRHLHFRQRHRIEEQPRVGHVDTWNRSYFLDSEWTASVWATPLS